MRHTRYIPRHPGFRGPHHNGWAVQMIMVGWLAIMVAVALVLAAL